MTWESGQGTLWKVLDTATWILALLLIADKILVAVGKIVKKAIKTIVEIGGSHHLVEKSDTLRMDSPTSFSEAEKQDL